MGFLVEKWTRWAIAGLCSNTVVQDFGTVIRRRFYCTEYTCTYHRVLIGVVTLVSHGCNITYVIQYSVNNRYCYYYYWMYVRYRTSAKQEGRQDWVRTPFPSVTRSVSRCSSHMFRRPSRRMMEGASNWIQFFKILHSAKNLSLYPVQKYEYVDTVLSEQVRHFLRFDRQQLSALWRESFSKLSVSVSLCSWLHVMGFRHIGGSDRKPLADQIEWICCFLTWNLSLSE